MRASLAKCGSYLLSVVRKQVLQVLRRVVNFVSSIALNLANRPIPHTRGHPEPLIKNRLLLAVESKFELTLNHRVTR